MSRHTISRKAKKAVIAMFCEYDSNKAVPNCLKPLPTPGSQSICIQEPDHTSVMDTNDNDPIQDNIPVDSNQSDIS
jgi:hypothetical protein